MKFNLAALIRSRIKAKEEKRKDQMTRLAKVSKMPKKNLGERNK